MTNDTEGPQYYAVPATKITGKPYHDDAYDLIEEYTGSTAQYEELDGKKYPRICFFAAYEAVSDALRQRDAVQSKLDHIVNAVKATEIKTGDQK